MSTSGLDTWRVLLRRAIRALDSLPGRGIEVPAWTFGGGTVLMLRYGHRTSRDIDLFLRDVQPLAALSPRLNDTTAALTSSYEEASSYLRLAFSEGEVDFIVAPDLLGLGHPTMTFEERTIRTDASEEIVAKKLFYRTAGLKVRDVVDLAVVLTREPEAAKRLRGPLVHKAAQLHRRLEILRDGFPERLAREVSLLPAGTALASRALEVASDFVEALERD